MIHALAFALMLAADSTGTATIRVQDYVPQPFESGSYPTHALSMEMPRPSEPPVAGYRRVTLTWQPHRVDSLVSTGYGKNTKSTWKPLYTLPGGTATRDEPINPGRVDLLFLGDEPPTEIRTCGDCTGAGFVWRPDPKEPKKLIKVRCESCVGIGKLGIGRSMWSCYRSAVPSWECYIGTDPFAPGQSRTMRLYPSSGEVVSVARTWRK
jgi:hypothetical protein